MTETLWTERGGAGEGLVVLLHGLGATAAVWRGVGAALAAKGLRWLAPDLRGHGRSPVGGRYGFGNHAADVSALLADEEMTRVTILGHSFGGVVGALVAGGLFGPVPARVVTLGVKQRWNDDEIAGARALSLRPARTFATRDEAQERYARVAGLDGLVSVDAPELAGGVRAVPGGFALAMAPGVFGAVGPSVEAILRGARAPLRMAAGSLDPMVALAEMVTIDPGAVLLDGLPHNAHVVAPDRVAALLD
ncbi:MAG: alpha/beta fold hydrolase [Rhodobacteraceae bacterium]|nr:alpha/beta fold hydrolase [Paracoccaceae bacterium]